MPTSRREFLAASTVAVSGLAANRPATPQPNAFQIVRGHAIWRDHPTNFFEGLLFPSAHNSGPARFHHLRAAGTFLVSAAPDGQAVSSITLLSEHGKGARLASGVVFYTRRGDKRGWGGYSGSRQSEHDRIRYTRRS